MRHQFLLIHNPMAGRRGNTLVRRVTAELSRRGAQLYGVEFDSEQPRFQSRAAFDAILARHNCDAALVAGGDGTIRAAAAVLAGTDLPIGIIPAGTGNVLANEIDLPGQADALADVLQSGAEISLEGAHLNGEPFYLMAGVGFDGEVINRLNVDAKRVWGKLAYIWPVVRALAQRPLALELTIDGKPYCASWVVVTRTRRYAGTFVIAADADPRQPGVHAVIVNTRTRRALVRVLFALATGRLDKCDDVEIVPCRRVTVDSNQPVAVEADGDPSGTTPVEIEAGKATLRLIVPNTFAAGASA